MTTGAVEASFRGVVGASPEFLLVVECCRSAFSGGDQERVAGLAARVNWSRFVRTARFHRVQGLVWKSLSSLGKAVPANVATQLAADAREIAAANLRVALESRELRATFTQAGVAMVFVKGLTVSSLAYGDSWLKMGWDIDVLIDGADIDEAGALLAGRGYIRILPDPEVGLRSWHHRRKESVWRSGDVHVELHTRLVDNLRLIPNIDVHSERREVELAPGISLPTLASDELFAYLCVHGASSLWFRLKWITDLAAILQQCDPHEIARLYAKSQMLGAGRASSSALLLADRLFGSLRDSQLRHKLSRDRANRWLCQAALGQLAGRPEPREPTEVVGGTFAIHVSQLALLPGLRFKAEEFLRQARDALS